MESDTRQKLALVVATFVATISFNTATIADTHIIEIKDFKFQPTLVTVKPGDTITWINRDIVPHTSSATTLSWDTGKIEPNQSVSIEVFENMETSYYCFYHPSMMAKIKLEPL